MLDRHLQPLLRPALAALARHLVRAGLGADAVSIVGCALGLLGAVAVAAQAPLAGLGLILASRLADGLDGAVAQLTTPTDRGAFLDIVLDFVFYAAVPLGFAFADPAANALPAAVLLAAFIGTGSSFLAFAALAAKRGLTAAAYPAKGLYYLGGLTEATETLVCFAAMCLLPAAFPLLSYVFAALCVLTLAGRIAAGWRALSP